MPLQYDKYAVDTVMPPSRPFIDIFCRVIDNYGDIGVCWRLAKDLHHIIQQQAHHSYHPFTRNSLYHSLAQAQHDNTIRLWVDNLASFRRIDPTVDTDKPIQHVKGITICQWQDAAKTIPALVVIEAFATELDRGYIDAMPTHSKYWFNLEYLSAESWVDSFHAQPSPQANGMTKYFFFPGFTAKTGGLIYEPYLHESIKHFQQDKKAIASWLARVIHPSLKEAFERGDRFISLFCYPDAPILPLLSALLACPRKTQLLLPEGVLEQLPSILKILKPYYPIQEKINLCRFSFVPQEQFDYLLAASDINIVRGEDSFIRAIWSKKPFLWHIYKQEKHIHLNKLEAWLTSYPMPKQYKTLTTLWNSLSHPSDIDKKALLTVFSHLITPLSQTNHKGNEWDYLLPILPYPPQQNDLNNETIGAFSLPIQQHSLSHYQQLHALFTVFLNAPQGFYTSYAHSLAQNPPLSFSLLNFQAKKA